MVELRRGRLCSLEVDSLSVNGKKAAGSAAIDRQPNFYNLEIDNELALDTKLLL